MVLGGCFRCHFPNQASTQVRFNFNFQTKRKGLQLALEPLNGRGIAGYVPKPELWTRPWWTASRENSHIVSALRVLGDVEALTFGLDVDAQADDDIDDLVEDR
jgi:hypothetical protein